MRRAVRAPQRRVRPSRQGRAALALRSRGRARTALSLTQPGSAPAVATGAAERLQTCSVSGPARVEATKNQPRRGRRRRAAERPPRAGGDHAGGPGKRGARRLLKIAPAEGSHPLPAHPLAARPRGGLSGSRNWRPTVPREQTPAGVAKAQSQPQAAGYGTPQPRAVQQSDTLRKKALKS